MPPARKSPLFALLLVALAAVYVPWAVHTVRADQRGRAHPKGRGETPGAPLPEPALLSARPLSLGLEHGGVWRGKPELADCNGDGTLDLIASLRSSEASGSGGGSQGEPGGLFLWTGDGAGRWRPVYADLLRGGGFGGARVGDADGDGFADVAFSGHEVPPRVFLGDGRSGWRESSEGIALEGPCADVALVDLDGDGRDELAVLGMFADSGGLRLFRRREDGRGWAREDDLLGPGGFGSQLLATDLDGDGQPELLAATGAGPRVWRFEEGELRDASRGMPVPPIGGSDRAIDAADLDGDGTSEILVAGLAYEGHPGLYVLRREGAAWRRWGHLEAGESYHDACFAELDGESPPEIVAAGRPGVEVIGVRAGALERLGRLRDTAGALNLTAGDVDGDGLDEIALVGAQGVRVLAPDHGIGVRAGGRWRGRSPAQ